MNVSNLDLSRELYELSGWKDTFSVYEQTDGIPMGEPYIAHPELEKRYGLWGTQELKKQTPAYDLGYLLKKLPTRTVISEISGRRWCAEHIGGRVDENSNRIINEGNSAIAYTPEDAAATLAIYLFRNGVLKKGDDE